MHVLAVEYPGYGLYKTCPPCERQIKEDSEIIYQYLTRHVGLKDTDIVLFGRSMGSGPATHLASKYPAFTLLLMSPYTSIKDVARSFLGKLSFLITPLVHERFRNIDAIKHAKCPLFLLHGEQDTLIPPSHARELLENCPTLAYLELAKAMDHNEFDFIGDLIRPFKDFVARLNDNTMKLEYETATESISACSTARLEIERSSSNGDPNSGGSFFTVYSDIDES